MSPYVYQKICTRMFIAVVFITPDSQQPVKCPLVAPACNPRYSGGRDQENRCSKPTRANRLQDPILKKPFTKRAGGVAQGVGPEFKPQYLKKE
jgi:hypothetical protein